MEQTAAARTRPAQEQGEEATDRRRKGSVISLTGFGLLLTVTLVFDALSDSQGRPGFALTIAGLMLSVGVADLLDPAARRVVLGVRYGGMAMAVIGLVLQWFW